MNVENYLLMNHFIEYPHLFYQPLNRLIETMTFQAHSYSVCSFIIRWFCIESPIKSKDLDLSLYSSKQLSPDYRIHWRILKEKNEIEIVAIVNGTSWVGLGWRPRKLNATCRNFPLIQKLSASGQPESVQLNAVKPTPEPESRKYLFWLIDASNSLDDLLIFVYL